MGNFVDAVRQDKIPGPLRREFKLKRWNDSFAALGQDEADKNLHLVGLLLNSKAATIRKQLKMTFSQEINATTKVRAFITLVNNDMLAVQRKMADARSHLTSSKQKISMPDIAGIRLPLADGQSFSADEIVQSLVDGVQISLKVVLSLNQSLSGSARFKGLVWNDVAFDFNLGNFYQQIEQLWDDCLWNDYHCESTAIEKIFSPRDAFWGKLKAASRTRQMNLAVEFYARAQVALDELIARGRLVRQRNVTSIEKENRRQVIRLSALGEPSQQTRMLLAAQAYAREPYYAELLSEPQAAIGGASLDDLLNAWAIVVQCTQLLAEKASGQNVEDASLIDRSANLAPVLQRDALRRALQESLGCGYKQSGDLVEFLTYRGLPAQELWAQPLVPVSDDAVAPIFAAALHADPLRLVDVWLRQFGVDMAVRGVAFEAYVRTELKDCIEDSPLLSHSKVLDREFFLRPIEDRKEEIDVLFVVDNLVVVGEAKCSVPPTDAKAYALHRRLIEGAVAQVSRKAVAVDRHRDVFRSQLSEMGIEVPFDFKILPIVILNAAFHAGMAVDGVPVVDMYVLNVFFSGKLVEVATGIDMKSVREKVLYKSVEEAVDQAATILKSPPQMTLFVNGIRENAVKMHAVAADDWEATYQTFDCAVDPSHLLSADVEEGRPIPDTLN